LLLIDLPKGRPITKQLYLQLLPSQQSIKIRTAILVNDLEEQLAVEMMKKSAGIKTLIYQGRILSNMR
jgi:hypothetical protein